MQSRHRGIPEQDCDILASTYEQSEQKYLVNQYSHTERNFEMKLQSPDGFVSNVDWRLYTEWCMEGYPGATSAVPSWPRRFGDYDKRYEEYDKIGVFEGWIRFETHLAMERLLAQSPMEMNEERYKNIRMEVIRAAARRAIELFTSWKSPYSGPEEDKRNLRTSLEPYISMADTIKE